MASSQQMRPDQAHNGCESEADKWMNSVKQAAEMDASDSKKEEPSSFLQQTGVQVKYLAKEAAGAMKNVMSTKNNEEPSDPTNGPIPFKPANDNSFHEFKP